MYAKAKNESEIDFCNCLVADDVHYVNTYRVDVKFIDIEHVACECERCIARAIDCRWHADVIAHAVDLSTSRMCTWFFDVKDVEDKNMSSGNYVLGKECINYCSNSDDENWLAFRLNDGKSKRFSKYIVVNALELCMKLPDLEDEDWCLVPLAEIESCIDKFYVEGDF